MKKAKVFHSLVIEKSFIKELSKTHSRLRDAKERFYPLYRKARSLLSSCDYIRLSAFLSDIDVKQRPKLRYKHNDTILRLRQDRFGSSNRSYDTIINLAGIELINVEKDVLCQGVDFGVPPTTREPEILVEYGL